MSARSPRGSLSGASSEEVADDFAESLKDLQSNDRLQISNLTAIAKECTEHAQAISRVLEQHIKATAPTRKLPALYLLDSIVKNVGTPYTVYLGKNLFSTFMNAYTLVDKATRRSMDGMFKTWKEPIPGSLDTKPVFEPDLTRPIENALIRSRTHDLQSGRQGQSQPHPEYRSTPTPPQYNGIYAPPQSQGQAQPYGYGVHQPTPLQQHVSSNYTPVPSQQQQLYQYAAPDSRPVNELESVKRDIATLITSRRGQLAANPYNQELQQQTATLQQLQGLLYSQQVQPHELQQIRAQIAPLAAQGSHQTNPSPFPSIPTQSQWQPPVSIPPQLSHPFGPPAPQQQPFTAPLQPQALPPVNLNVLNGLQALLANGQKPSTPQLRAAAPELQHASHTQLNNFQNQTASTPALHGADLIAALSRSGVLQSLPTANPTPPVVARTAPPVTLSAVPPAAPPSQQSTASLLQSLQSILPTITSHTGTPTQVHAQLSGAVPTGKPRIPISAASLKTFRPELIHALYDAQPNQCSTCGRRFTADDEGRAKKSRHLDWHFRTNQRMADASIARGAHRDWYPTEMEWITLSDFDPSTATAEATASANKPAAAAKGPKDQYVKAPPGVTKNVCSIDFEEMRASYSEELQEWVFTNAALFQGKIVHATCLAELQRGSQLASGRETLAAAFGGQGRRERSATPDSSLGKRRRAD